MKRRELLLAACALASWPIARAQQPGRTYRIGGAYVAPSAITTPFEESFLAGLRKLGFEGGRNLIYETRSCNGDPSRLPALVDELIALKPDLLVGIEQVARVMRSKTSMIPIVLTSSTDPVAAGLAKTLARPGGNVTGIAALNEVLGAKSVELLVELLPQAKTLAILLDPGVPAAGNVERHVQKAAKTKGLSAITYWAKDRTTLEQAFAAMERNRPDGLITSSGSGQHFGERQFIANSALRLRLPYMAATAPMAEAGALFTYGADLHASFRRAASHAARILNGANPAEMPIEQPTKFELVINLKTAKTLGLKIPQSILLRADRVIE